jgi:hypothetical protein
LYPGRQKNLFTAAFGGIMCHEVVLIPSASVHDVIIIAGAGDALILSDLRRRFRQPAARRGVSLCYPLLIASSSASARPSCCKSVIDPAAAAIMVMQLFWVYF